MTAPKTVAVLPFRWTGPAEEQYLADGVTDDLIDTLSMTKGLRVRPRGFGGRSADQSMDARALGRELDVQVVVTGSIRRDGESSSSRRACWPCTTAFRSGRSASRHHPSVASR